MSPTEGLTRGDPQIPIFETRSDGRDNFVVSLLLAGQFTIPEVTVFFNHELFRGNRTTKISTGKLNAFGSPNLTPLASVGIEIEGALAFHFPVHHINITRIQSLYRAGRQATEVCGSCAGRRGVS